MIRYTPKLPDIGWIKNEPRYFVGVLNKSQTRERIIKKNITKRAAMKRFVESAERGIPVRVFHYGKTDTGVIMLMPDRSWNWKIKEKKV
jgi:hypothetical protein